jgi:hypothetical protein
MKLFNNVRYRGEQVTNIGTAPTIAVSDWSKNDFLRDLL